MRGTLIGGGGGLARATCIFSKNAVVLVPGRREVFATPLYAPSVYQARLASSSSSCVCVCRQRRDARTAAGNPGTEDAAVVDMFLLADSHDILITSSSSFGFTAAGLGGLRAYYVAEHGV